MKTHPRLLRSQRGSVLLTALIFSFIIALSMTTYLRLSRTGMDISNRSLYLNAAMNLAENGLEEAVYSINKTVADSSYDWSAAGWTISGANARQKWSGATFGQSATGETRAYIYNYHNSASPRIVTRSIVSLTGGGARTMEKWVQVQLRKTSKFSNGLVAKDSISFSGNNASVDSWVSDPTGTGTPIVPYSNAVKRDNGSVGSISVSVSAVLVNNADIWGYAATGGAQPSVGTNGVIGPFGTAVGTINPSRVSTDFAANFDPVTAPTATYSDYGGAIVTDVSLPRVGIDPVSADGYYYISADSVNFTNKTLTITNKVVLRLTNTTTAIDIGGGSGALNINTGAELKVYSAGEIKIAGQGLMNGGTTAATANPPAKCQFYGTRTIGTQPIQIAGNGALSAVVYAPNGSVKINGNGDVCGSIVANDITVVGNAAFHYDESLANFGGNNPYRVSQWKELTTAAERAAVAADLTF